MQVTVSATDFDDEKENAPVATFNPNFERKPVVSDQETNTSGLNSSNQLDIDSDTSEFVPTFFKKK